MRITSYLKANFRPEALFGDFFGEEVKGVFLNHLSSLEELDVDISKNRNDDAFFQDALIHLREISSLQNKLIDTNFDSMKDVLDSSRTFIPKFIRFMSSTNTLVEELKDFQSEYVNLSQLTGLIE